MVAKVLLDSNLTLSPRRACSDLLELAYPRWTLTAQQYFSSQWQTSWCLCPGCILGSTVPFLRISSLCFTDWHSCATTRWLHSAEGPHSLRKRAKRVLILMKRPSTWPCAPQQRKQSRVSRCLAGRCWQHSRQHYGVRRWPFFCQSLLCRMWRVEPHSSLRQDPQRGARSQ